MPIQRVWSRRIIWGSHRLSHGVIKPSANAWKTGVLWGAAKTLASDGDNIVWGTMSDGDNIVWGTGRRRQHRLGHGGRWRQHRLGHR